ncbi:hypothetical protein ACIHCQ_37580 [Streptomyces sp. NPDC052236]|uniref:hypothetical protein n=1 Tax=Streptomyces sp. NPDC052236 TaxID=3365686 RepID=UPI0037D60D73
MATMTPSGEFESLLRIVEELDTPDGYKAELIRGKIVVSPWPVAGSSRPLRSLRQQLKAHAPEGLETAAGVLSGGDFW